MEKYYCLFCAIVIGGIMLGGTEYGYAQYYQQPAPNYQQPAPNYQQTAPNYQQPVPNYRQPVPVSNRSRNGTGNQMWERIKKYPAPYLLALAMLLRSIFGVNKKNEENTTPTSVPQGLPTVQLTAMDRFLFFINGVTTKYYCFTGRARRAEYWILYTITFFLLCLLLGMLSNPSSISLMGGILLLVSLLPLLGVTVRRFHDINMSGWHMLWVGLAVYFLPELFFIPLIVFGSIEGTKGDNQYGPSEKYITISDIQVM